jgi:hypothetical protein
MKSLKPIRSVLLLGLLLMSSGRGDSAAVRPAFFADSQDCPSLESLYDIALPDGARLRLGSSVTVGCISLLRKNGSIERRTDPFTSFQLFDFDEDDMPEVLLDETTMKGTGILGRKFRLYRLEPTQVRLIWEAHSFTRESPSAVKPRIEQSLVRFDPSGGALPSRLTHITLGNNRSCSLVVISLERGRLQESRHQTCR